LAIASKRLVNFPLADGQAVVQTGNREMKSERGGSLWTNDAGLDPVSHSSHGVEQTFTSHQTLTAAFESTLTSETLFVEGGKR